MAVLTDREAKRRVDRALQKDRVLKSKVEKQKKKELYSEKWYQDELKKRQKELEEVAPTKEDDTKKNRNLLPTFFDSFDINTLFDPVKLIRDDNDKNVKIKLEQYKQNERIFEPTIVKTDSDCYKVDELKEFYNRTYTEDEEYKQLVERRKELERKLNENRKARLVEEKNLKTYNITSESLKILEDEKKEIEDLIAEYEEQGITSDDINKLEDNEVPSINNKTIWSKLGEFRSNFFAKCSQYFYRFVPVYDKYICTCCGKAKELDEYYIYYNESNLSRMDPFGNVRLSICKKCSEKLFNYLYIEKANKSVEVAMKMFCANLNIYYENKILVQALRNFSVNEHENHLIKEYLDLLYINEENIEKNFLESPFLIGGFNKNNNQNIIELDENGDMIEDPDEIAKDTEPMTWTKEDIRNRKQVKRMIGYDPFEYETDENKVILYNDLLNMLEAGMENDMVKVQAAIQIVLGYFRIRQINQQEFEMRKTNASLADLKALAEIKSKELNAISKFCQDNGFSERFATAKAKGENTFTGVMKKMLNDKFEIAIPNKFDIDTSVTIQQAADASITAMFKQLNMSTAEYGVLMGKQLKEIESLRKENALLVEQMRKFKYDEKKQELIQEAKDNGVYENYEEDNDDYDEDE